MTDIIGWILLGLIALVGILFIFFRYIKPLVKMSKEERQATIVKFLYGLVVIAENDIKGSGKGAQKLAYVEQLFKKQAPLIYRIILMISGKDSLVSLIEEALSVVKNNFEKAA